MTEKILAIRKMVNNRYPDSMTIRDWCVAYVEHRLRSIYMHPGEDCRSADATTLRERAMRDRALEELKSMGLGGHLDSYPI